MTQPTELPVGVIDAIHAGRKIEAIKLLREERGIDLKEAKELVDAYAKEHPELVVVAPATNSIGWLILLILCVAGAYVVLN